MFWNTCFFDHISLNIGRSDLYLVAFDSPYNFASVSVLQNLFYILGVPSTKRYFLDPENGRADFIIHESFCIVGH
jgi:hypothetical protein